MKEARVLSFNVRTGEFNTIIVKELEDFYKALECDCFDVVRRKVGGKPYDIFVDDIGLYRDNPIPSAISSYMSVQLVGNLIFTNTDSEGNTISLSDDDIEHIKSCVINMIDCDNGYKNWTAVFPVDV